MYKNLKTILTEAQNLNSTVGAFNAHNLEMVPDMIRAAKDAGAPIIIQTSAGTAQYIGMKTLVALCKSMAEDLLVDVDLHLDHAKTFDDIKEAIDSGYSSVMFDGSSLLFKENMEKSLRVVDYAHARNVSVECEIGTIGGTEEGVTVAEGKYTDPEQAVLFLQKVDVDALAVGVGTHHGQFKSKTQLNWDLIEKLHSKINTPLVIHGGTGVSENDYHRLTNNGIRKFNVGTELLVTWTRTAQRYFGKTEVNQSLRNNIVPCNKAIYDIVLHKSKLFLNKDTKMNVMV
ncbi:class II fructose-bisphosphate aldolase [Liquorilactobacillus satsumensis]|uniref:Fructose-bisphosphate aldolase n=1 Tax=Liquorilactobacillus satsumensis DSM 16230 = JCM 12392 TaxID=1423801 RepID=A0A0R1UZW8_9LACO|nr:class II fructose-bisphosphate aldolase [Liquorilactobacillus satsumensis]KRL98734.1 fructose-bisphosphate aldolase [Liquorilactobacillus satsumensis DSM 16230 = JCM 12392]MCP9311689.1 class II fructose-bisphosphate aldolase [Liquorilactobacillus satsumensis]MCP9358822.1 class II fructose-bisphosphate aldolase [Liquorilactobacillus satsumensis]